jgi:hypothetical protein
MPSKENPFLKEQHIQNSLRNLDYEIKRERLFINNKRQQMGRRGFSTKERNAMIREIEDKKRQAEHIRLEFGFPAQYPEARGKIKEKRIIST